MNKPYLCIDTNIILLDANNLLTLGKDNIIVLPETVLDETDNKKSGHSEIAFQAREFGRLLTKATKTETVREGNLVISKLELQNVQIEIVSLVTYPSYEDTEPNIINDRKIIEVALQYREAGKLPLKFMSNDVMCRIRADSLGLESIDLKNVELNNLQFTKTIQVDPNQFTKLHNLPITSVDPEYKPRKLQLFIRRSILWTS